MHHRLPHLRLSRRSFATAIAVSAAMRVPASEVIMAQDPPLPAWEQLAAGQPAPPARWDHVLAADEAGNRLILFGGRDTTGTALDDTWAFDLGSGAWTQLATAGPQPRFGVAAAVDSTARTLYVFGGQYGDIFYNDTWAFDLATDAWTQLHDGTNVAPSPRYGLGAVVDNAGRLLISHGFTFEGRFDDTWACDPASRSWTDITPTDGVRPLNRCLHEQVWSPESDAMILYGGCSSGFGPCPQGDTWVYDAASGTWREVTPATGPDARSNPGLVLTAGEEMILFGGLTAAGYANDAWSGSFQDGVLAWRSLDTATPSPGPRASHDMAVLGSRVYLFGGLGDAGALDDLWVLDS